MFRHLTTCPSPRLAQLKMASVDPALKAPLYILAFLAVVISSLLLRPGPTRVFLFLPLVAAFCATTAYYRTDSKTNDYSLGCNVAYVTFSFIDRLILSNAESEFFKIGNGATEDTRGKPIAPPLDSWSAKLQWSCALWTSQRGVNWSWKVKNVPLGVPHTYPAWYWTPQQTPFPNAHERLGNSSLGFLRAGSICSQSLMSFRRCFNHRQSQ